MRNKQIYSSLMKKMAAAAVSFSMMMGMAAYLFNNTELSPNTVMVSAEEQKTGENIPEPELGPGTKSVDGCTYKYYLGRELNGTSSQGEYYIRLDTAAPFGDKLIIPSEFDINGYKVPVRELNDGFGAKLRLKEISVPDTIKRIGNNVFYRSETENFSLRSKELTYIGDSFFEDGIVDNADIDIPNIEHAGLYLFMGNSYLSEMYENGYVFFGNVLLAYAGEEKNIRISDVNGGKITCIAHSAFRENNTLESVDLTGVRNISDCAFFKASNLAQLKGTQNIELIEENAFSYTAWDSAHANDDVVVLGDFLYRYTVKGNTLDLSDGSLDKVKYANYFTFRGDTIKRVIANSTTQFLWDEHIWSSAFFNMEELIVDGKKISYSKDTPLMTGFIADHYWIIADSKLERDFANEIIKDIFNKLGITYYGPNNKKKGTLTPDEEFRITKQIHDYMVTHFEYQQNSYSFLQSLTCNREIVCKEYAQLTAYMLECAGVEAEAVYAIKNDENGNVVYYGHHAWNIVRIDGNWYHMDNTWDSKGYAEGVASTNTYFLISDELISKETLYHKYWDLFGVEGNAETSFFVDTENLPECKLLPGDANGDGVRDEKDIKLLKDLFSDHNSDDMMICDMNFDDVLNMNDMTLLMQITLGRTADPVKNEAASDDFPDFPQPISVEAISYFLDMPKADLLLGSTAKQHGNDAFVPYNIKPELHKGDVNGDDQIDIIDVSVAVNHINGIKALDKNASGAADVNGDGQIDIIDVSMIVSHINGIKPITDN